MYSPTMRTTSWGDEPSPNFVWKNSPASGVVIVVSRSLSVGDSSPPARCANSLSISRHTPMLSRSVPSQSNITPIGASLATSPSFRPFPSFP